jgi:hypothetical protein
MRLSRSYFYTHRVARGCSYVLRFSRRAGPPEVCRSVEPIAVVPTCLYGVGAWTPCVMWNQRPWYLGLYPC